MYPSKSIVSYGRKGGSQMKTSIKRSFRRLFLCLLIAAAVGSFGVFVGAEPLLTASAEDFVSGGFTYTVADNEATLTGYDDASVENLMIPKALDGYAVAAIGDNAFAGCTDITSVSVPVSVTAIGENAFGEAKSLAFIYYAGSSEQWAAVSIAENNEALASAEIKVNAVCEHTHSYSQAVTKEPTCAEKGVTTYTCIYCDDSYTQEIPATGEHTYKTVITKATTAKDGQAVTSCTVCGEVSKTETIAKVTYFKLSVSSYAYDGKTKTPTVTVKDSTGKVLKKNTDYTLKAPSDRKAVGSYTVTVTLTGKYSGSKSLVFTIVPNGTSLTSLTPTFAGFTAKWKKQTSQTAGYQLQYALSSSFSSYKTLTVKNISTTSLAVSKLKGSTKYYVRVRTYSAVGGKYYYSAWSPAAAVKTEPQYGIKMISSASLYVGGSGTISTVTSPAKVTVKWKSSDTSVAKVSTAGKVTAVKKGTATITAYFTYGGATYKATCKLTVKTPTIKLSKTSLTLTEKNTYQLKAETAPTGVTVKWKSSNTSILTVSSTGKITAVKSGKATVTAYFVYGSVTYRTTCSVTVVTKRAANFDKVKSFIDKNGYTNQSGNKVIVYSAEDEEYTYDYGIAYDKKSGKLQFLYLGDRKYSTGFEHSLSMEISKTSTSTTATNAILYYEYNEPIGAAVATSSIQMSKFTSSTKLSYTFSKDSTANMKNQSIKNLLDAELQVAFQVWNEMLKSTVGVTMRDLGFTSYK